MYLSFVDARNAIGHIDFSAPARHWRAWRRRDQARLWERQLREKVLCGHHYRANHRAYIHVQIGEYLTRLTLEAWIEESKELHEHIIDTLIRKYSTDIPASYDRVIRLNGRLGRSIDLSCALLLTAHSRKGRTK